MARLYTAAALGLALASLAACQTGTDYYAARCADKGLTPGTPEHQACMAEERAWIERNQEDMRRARGGGP